eukprot:763929-Hanusia_phi.AAC.14
MPMQELGPMSSLLKDCCKIAGFAYGEVWAREDVEIAKILSTGQRLEAADVMPRLAHHAEVEMSKMNDLSDVKVELASLADQPHHHSEEVQQRLRRGGRELRSRADTPGGGVAWEQCEHRGRADEEGVEVYFSEQIAFEPVRELCAQLQLCHPH